MKEKHPCCTKLVCFKMPKKENFRPEVLKYKSGQTISFAKTAELLREPFLTMFYTINSSLHCMLPSKL